MMWFGLLLSLSVASSAISGIVKDSGGGVIAGAVVVVENATGARQQTVTGPDGRFAFDVLPPGKTTLTVRANGFAVFTQPLATLLNIEIVLAPATLLESVTVTPSRGEQRLSDVSASVNVIDRQTVRTSPAYMADDVLRQIPTFSLFTRASSLSAHPTSQGVSLRGIGPSGVSRTLVLADGIPVNDPFGGWVYWTRVPMERVDRIEVVNGPSSSLYGNYAMGGVINIITARPTGRAVEFKPQFGNRSSRKLDYSGTEVWRDLGIAVEGSSFHTDGFPIVVLAERGAIDNNAAVEFHNVNVKADYRVSPRASTFVQTGSFREDRANGKFSTTDGVGKEEGNDTTWRFVNGGVRLNLPGANALQANVFSNFNTFHSNFLAVPAATPARSVARATLNQTVPTRDAGGMVQWSRAFGTRNVVTAGTDFHWVRGESQEDGLDATIGTQVILHRVSGGRQRSAGLFIQDVLTPAANLTISVAVRVDRFRNYDAHNLENTVAGGVIGLPTVNNNAALPERTDTVGTPRIGAVYHATDRINVWANVNSGFRAPTLNELYRQFRKGTTTTLANYSLVPERLVGSEGGVSVVVNRAVTARATLFDNRVRNPVTNVTITTPITPANLPTASATCTPGAAQICVQRQNVGRTEIVGFQTDVEFRLREWMVTGSYMHEKASVKSNDTNTALVGNLLPQVPRNRGSVRIAYMNPKIAIVSFDLQGVGDQFDDDLNTPSRLLPGYGAAGLTVSREVVKRVEAFVGVQNMFNKTFNVATLPTTIGSPRMVAGGVRIRWSAR